MLGIDEEYKPLYTKGERANMTIANIVIAKISVRENDDGRFLLAYITLSLSKMLGFAD